MTRALRRLAKEVTGRLIYATGQHRRLLRGKAMVVAFHTIGEGNVRNSIQVRPALFREYCAFFRKHFDVVSLSTLLELLDDGKDVSGKLVITFDDGYKDNYTNAAPVLEAAGLPATFFIATDFIGSTTTPWWDEEWGVASEWMSWDEIIDLDRRGFDIGAHTRSHPNLKLSPEGLAREEIAGSKADLEGRLGHPVAHFAYPYGRRGDSSRKLRNLVREAGFKCCMSCHGGLIGAGVNAMDLPRLPINDWYDSPFQFGLDAVRDVTIAGGEYDDSRPAGDRVLVVSYHMYPDAEVGARRPSELMHFLATSGYQVDGLAGRPGPKVQADVDLLVRLRGLRVMRVPQPPSVTDWLWKHFKSLAGLSARGAAASGAEIRTGQVGARESPSAWLRRQYNAMFGMFDAHKAWAFLSALRLCFNWGRRYQIVISSGPPSASHLVGCVAARLNRARYVMDFRDPWVGNSHVSPDSNSRLRNWLETRAERACIRRAEFVAVTTPGIERMLVNRYPEHAHKIRTIYNGYDGEPAPFPTEPPGRFDMLYAGTLYLNRNPFPILEALKAMLAQPGIERRKTSMTFAGHCETWNGQSLREWVKANGMSDIVRIHPPVSKREVDELTRKSTVLVNFAQGQQDQIPAKTFEYLASGRLMLLVSEASSSTAQLVQGVAAVVLVTPSDSTATIAETLSNLYHTSVRGMGAMNAKALDISRFSRNAQHHNLARILQNKGELQSECDG